MAKPVYTPRLNNNDDEVLVKKILVEPNTWVEKETDLIELETDKVLVSVSAEHAGYLKRIDCIEGTKAKVGSVLAWLVDNLEERLPEKRAASNNNSTSREFTLGAAKLAAEYGLKASQIPSSQEKLTTTHVKNYIQQHPELCSKPIGEESPLTSQELAMIKTVTWHQQSAVSGYIESPYDHAAWEQYAQTTAQKHRLMQNPLISLLAYHVVQAAKVYPKLNHAIMGNKKWQPANINLGFTIQINDQLYLATVHQACQLSALEFIYEMAQLQKQAVLGKLQPQQTQGATIGFTSMGKWDISRHIPILAPQTSLMIAHSKPMNENPNRGILGASYDHRLLTGDDVAKCLKTLSTPPEIGER